MITRLNAQIIDCSDVRRVIGPGSKPQFLVSFYCVFPGRFPGEITSLYANKRMIPIDGRIAKREAFNSRFDKVVEGFVVNDIDLAEFGGKFPTIFGFVTARQMASA